MLPMAWLRRTERTVDGVFGRLTGSGINLVTVEDDWRDNQRNVSCIPAGLYLLRRTLFYRHGYETFEVCDVPDRTRILIHIANTEEDVEGCIGVGLRLGSLRVRRDEDTHAVQVLKRAALESAIAHRRFMEAMEGVDVARLSVEWDPAIDPALGMGVER